MNLYSSHRFALIGIMVSGKKDTAGCLCFRGMTSPEGAADEIVAFEEGIVLAAGRATSAASRMHGLGVYITISGRSGVTTTYARLAERRVSVGDYVKKGQVIGVEGNTGAGREKYLLLEFRRNGRRIDAPSYLGIRPELQEFDLTAFSTADIVCEVCKLPDEAREAINSTSDAGYIWDQIYTNLRERPIR